MIRQNRNSHLFYSEVSASENRLKDAHKDDNERESKLRYDFRSSSNWVGFENIFRRYSRLIEEINEDQLDDQMDDEGSGSDSENSEDNEHGDNVMNNNEHGEQISFEEDEG